MARRKISVSAQTWKNLVNKHRRLLKRIIDEGGRHSVNAGWVLDAIHLLTETEVKFSKNPDGLD